jgi:hypothetical protein
MVARAIEQNIVDLWDDQRTPLGAPWEQEIESALSSARIAVLLVSPDFLASHSIVKKELRPLLRAALQEGVLIIWIYLRFCLSERAFDLSGY